MTLPLRQIESAIRVLRECVESRERSCMTYPCDACGIEDSKILATARLIRQYLDQTTEIITGREPD